MLHTASFIFALYIVPRPVSFIDSSTLHPADSHQFKNELVFSSEFEVITRKIIIPLPPVLKSAGTSEYQLSAAASIEGCSQTTSGQ